MDICLHILSVCLEVELLDPTVNSMGFSSGSAVKNLSAMPEPQETWVPSLSREDPLEEEMATHSSILA